jgi:Ca2+-binding EF-hand superfamily protein
MARFTALDSDFSGSVSAKQFHAVLNSLGIALSATEMKHLQEKYATIGGQLAYIPFVESVAMSLQTDQLEQASTSSRCAQQHS